MRKSKVYKEKLRTLPHAPKRPYVKGRKVYLKEHIDEAKEFYRKDLSGIAHRGNRGRALQTIKFFTALHYWYEGHSVNEIAFRMKLSASTVQSGIKRCEARVERYLKIKEQTDETI